MLIPIWNVNIVSNRTTVQSLGAVETTDTIILAQISGLAQNVSSEISEEHQTTFSAFSTGVNASHPRQQRLSVSWRLAQRRQCVSC
jgi:hypothetical protein